MALFRQVEFPAEIIRFQAVLVTLVVSGVLTPGESSPKMLNLGHGSLPFNMQTVVVGAGSVETVVTLPELFDEHITLGMGEIKLRNPSLPFRDQLVVL